MTYRHDVDEYQEQCALIRRAQLNPITAKYLYAYDTGPKKDLKRAAQDKRKGVRAGIPDLCLPVPSGIYHGLYIELKKPKTVRSKAGVITTSQQEWLNKLNEQGYKAVVAYGWQEAWEIIMDYLNHVNNS